MHNLNLVDDNNLSLTQHTLPNLQAAAVIKQSHDIAVVGGGFCGTTAVINILSKYHELEQLGTKLPEINLLWFDQNKSFGRGLAYSQQNETRDNHVLILNQPAYAMSPFASKPEAYSAWLKSNKLPYNEYSFTPRSLYGDFLIDCLNQLEARLKKSLSSINITRIPNQIKSLIHDQEQFNLSLDSGENQNSTNVLLALGHKRTDQFIKFQNNPNYLNKPWDIGKYRSLLINQEDAKAIHFIGGGQTTIDAIRILEHLRYKGKYKVISSAPGLPWPYDAELYRPESFDGFKAHFFTLDNFPYGKTYLDYYRLLKEEIFIANKNGYGRGHVFFGCDFDQIIKNQPTNTNSKGLEAFIRLIRYYRASVSAPESCELLHHLHQIGKLQLIKGRAVADLSQYNEENKNFLIHVRSDSGKELQKKAKILVNCSVLDKNARTNKFLNLKSDNFHSQVQVVGPPAVARTGLTETWGVESFREQIEKAALAVLRQSINQGG